MLLLAGCVAGGPPVRPAPAGEKTWYRDVLPMVQAHCASCHSEEGAAPFTLTEDEARKRSKALVASLQTGLMPPWLPSKGCQTFKEERRLADADVATVVEWVNAGMKAGDPRDSPTAVSEPGLAWTDVTLAADPYTTEATQVRDDYRCFLLDPKLDRDRDLIGFQITPGAPKQVHHVVLYSAARADATAQDLNSPGPGWPCFGGPSIRTPVVVGGWAPGTPKTQYPANTGIRLVGDKVLVLQVHYIRAQSEPISDRTVVRLQLSKDPVLKLASILPLSKSTFEIPPHTRDYRVIREYLMPSDATLWGLMPQMNQRGRKVVAKSDGNCLISIDTWDFQWHQFYFFASARGVPLKTAEKIELTCEYDNPTAAPIFGGEGADDERCLSYLLLTYEH